VQSHGLDDTGTNTNLDDADFKPITVEIVRGRREQLYWEKVPEKVRRQAVQKVTADDDKSGPEEETATRQRKRQRREK
jgi:hypothetical protein